MSLENILMAEINIVRPKIVSNAKLVIQCIGVSYSAGVPRCFPAEVGSALPRPEFKPPTRQEHPAEMSTTVDSGVRPKEPANGSSLVTESPREPSLDQGPALLEENSGDA